MKRKIKAECYKIYSWLYNLLYLFLDIMPMFIRDIFWRLIFQKYTTGMIDYKAYFRYPSKIVIGKKVAINRGCCFLASAHTKEKINIEIGDNCVFAPEVSLLTASHDYSYLDLPDTFGKIKIEDNVWIGKSSIILPGVTIGEGAVVGGGSVVTKDVAPYTVVAGNPARKIADRKIHGYKFS